MTAIVINTSQSVGKNGLADIQMEIFTARDARPLSA
jgi:hypothetical protein